MRSLHHSICDNLLPFGNHEFKVEFLIWEGSSKHAKEELKALPIPGHLRRQAEIVVRAIRSDIEVGTIEITRIDDFIVETLKLLLIPFLSGHT